MNKLLASWFGEDGATLKTRKIDTGYVNDVYAVTQGINIVGVLRRTSKPLESILFEEELLCRLCEKDFPVPKLYKTREGYYHVNNGHGFYQLFEFIDGRNLSENDILSNHLELVGEVLASMGNILIDFEPHTLPKFSTYGQFISVVDRTRRKDYIKSKILTPFKKIDEDLVRDCQKVFDDIEKRIEDLYCTLPKQVIHGDCTRDNILFGHKYDGITGVIDFDDAHIDPRIFDPVVATIYFAKENGIFILKKASIIHGAYANALESPLSTEEVESICDLTKLYSLFALVYTMNRHLQTEPNLEKVEEYRKLFYSVNDVEPQTWKTIV